MCNISKELREIVTVDMFIEAATGSSSDFLRSVKQDAEKRLSGCIKRRGYFMGVCIVLCYVKVQGKDPQIPS